MMLQEPDYVPYTLAQLPAGPWLVFAPHADDETFGLGGTLLRARAAQIAVTLVVLTDGALGGEAADLVAQRETEVSLVAERLGIHELQFWRYPDRSLYSCNTVSARVSELVQCLQPASVFFTSPFEPHPDHRACAALVWEGLRQAPVFAGTAYAYEVATQSPLVNRLVDISAQAAEKMALMRLYHSQVQENDYPELIEALNRYRTYSLPASVSQAEALYAFAQINQSLDDYLTQEMQMRLYALGLTSSAKNEDDNQLQIAWAQERQALYARIQALETSHSWRLTAPLRRLVEYWRR